MRLCYFAQYYYTDLLGVCNSFDHGEYYWFIPDGSSTCETVWGKESWLGFTSVKKPEDTTYHFPPSAFDLADFTKGLTDCVFMPNEESDSDSFYSSVSDGGNVASVRCRYAVSADQAECYKAYKKFDITAGQGRREIVQLATMVWTDQKFGK